MRKKTKKCKPTVSQYCFGCRVWRPRHTDNVCCDFTGCRGRHPLHCFNNALVVGENCVFPLITTITDRRTQFVPTMYQYCFGCHCERQRGNPVKIQSVPLVPDCFVASLLATTKFYKKIAPLFLS